jgi:hypothetical protein
MDNVQNCESNTMLQSDNVKNILFRQTSYILVAGGPIK